MSDFLAEARIIVRPDTSRFRIELEAQLRAATATPIRIPVVPVMAGGGIATATAETNAFTAAQANAANAEKLRIVRIKELEKSLGGLSGAEAAHARSLSQLARGAGASGLTLFGLRGATLAASGAFLAGTAAVVAFSKAVQSAAQLQTELNVFRVAAGATADEMKRASEEAQALGRDLTLPGVTAGDAAEAMTALAKAGLSVQDSLDATKGTLQLATAAQIDNVDATNLVASALNSFSLAGSEAIRVADLLTGAAKESQGEITDMGTALQQASAVAKLAGISLEDTVTFLTELARAGIAGGRAGTSLRVAILRLINPTAGAAAALEKLNVQLRDSQGRVRAQVFTDIAAALEGMTKAQQQATLATIFGSDAVRAAAIIGSQGAVSFRELRDSITEAGLAQEQAAARTSGFQGSIENLKNQFESLGTTVGKFVIGPGKALADFFATTVSDANALIGALSALNQKSNEFDAAFNEALGISPDTGEKIGETLKKGILLGLRIGPQAIEFTIDATKLRTDAAKVRQEIDDIVNTGKQTGGEVGLNQTLVLLDQLVEKLKAGGPSAQKFADSVKKVRDNLFAAQGIKLFPDNIRDLFPPELLPESERILGEVGAKGGKSFKDQMMANAIPGNLTPEVFVGFTNAIEGAALSAADKVKIVMAGIVRDATVQLAGLDEAFDVAVAAGNNKAQLAVLRQQAAEQQRIRDAADKAAKEIGAGNKGFATAVKTRREAQAKLASINTQIRSIEGQIASDAKQAASEAQRRADEAQKARDASDRAFLDQIGFKEGGLQNQILLAGTTKALADDIARNKALRDFYKQSREQAAKTIRDADLRLKTIQSFTRDIIQITKTITDLQKQQAAAEKEARDARNARIEESLQFDIAFAATKNNRSGEIRAREQLIAQLKKEQALVKRGTNEWKKLRNEIAEEQKAINELRGTQQKKDSSFFDFLQTQQGFASRLLGNLIPSGATGGIVGGRVGGAPVQTALQPVAGAAEARSTSGVTAGQGNRTNHILQMILEQLKELNGDQKAPEAARQWQTQRNTMDGVGGG